MDGRCGTSAAQAWVWGPQEGASPPASLQTISHAAVVSSPQGAEIFRSRPHALLAEWGTSQSSPTASCCHLRDTCVWLSCSGDRTHVTGQLPVTRGTQRTEQVGQDVNLSEVGERLPSQHEIPQGTQFLLLVTSAGAAPGSWCRM